MTQPPPSRPRRRRLIALVGGLICLGLALLMTGLAVIVSFPGGRTNPEALLAAGATAAAIAVVALLLSGGAVYLFARAVGEDGAKPLA